MTRKLDYQIVVPSRKRAGNMPKLLKLLPTASVCVEDREVVDYLRYVPREQLVLHPPLDRMSKVRNWILDKYQAQAIAMFDDDLQYVRSMVWGRGKRYTEAEIIRQIIENGVNLAADLAKSLFCWSRMAHPVGYSNCDPFALTSPISSALVVVGRGFRFDENLCSKADIDISLQALLKDRVVLMDRRWYFDFGRIFGNPGGDQGQRTMEKVRADEATLKAKWRGHVVLGKDASSGGAARSRGRRKQAIVGGFRVAVCRRSPLANRGQVTAD